MLQKERKTNEISFVVLFAVHLLYHLHKLCFVPWWLKEMNEEHLSKKCIVIEFQWCIYGA